MALILFPFSFPYPHPHSDCVHSSRLNETQDDAEWSCIAECDYAELEYQWLGSGQGTILQKVPWEGTGMGKRKSMVKVPLLNACQGEQGQAGRCPTEDTDPGGANLSAETYCLCIDMSRLMPGPVT